MMESENKMRDIQRQINEQNIIQSELKQLKSKSKVFHKQQNSNIFFVSSIDKEMNRAKDTLDDLMKEYQEAERSSKVSTESA